MGQMGREDVRKPARRHGSSPALQRLSMAQNSRVPSGVPSTGQEPWGYLLPCQSNPWSVEALTGELDFTGIWKHPHLHRGTGTSVLKS